MIDHLTQGYHGQSPDAIAIAPALPAVGPCDTQSGFVLDEFTASGKMTSPQHPF